jgi:outer membrane protein assembly factor BamB
VWITIASLAAATLMVRANLLEPIVGGVVDQAVRNIITLILGFSGLMAALLWFLRESGHEPRLKKAVLAGLLGLVALAAAALRIERVSGDLVPEFAFRWNPSRDRLLPRQQVPAAAAHEAAAWTATPADFPAFLGPDGSCSLDVPRLDPDWAARPPQLMWRRPIGAGWSGFASCGDHAVTLEQRGDEELVTCCGVTTGEPEWTVAVPGRHETVLGGVGPRSTPTIRDGVVYTHGAGGWLHAIEGASGRVLWKKNVVDELGIDPAAHAALVAWGRAGSPLVTDDLVIVPAGGPRTRRAAADPEFLALVAFDRASGAQRWTAGEEQISYVTPRLVEFGGRQLVMSVNEAHVAAYDPADGRELWEVAWPGHSNSDASCSQPVPLDDRRFFVSKGYGIGAAVFELVRQDADPWVLREVWRAAGLLKTKFTNVALHDGHVYGLSDGILECVRVADGVRRWKGGRYGQGQLLRVGDLLLVQAESGEVVLLDAAPDGHRVRGRLSAIAGQTWNNLCLSGDRLLVRNAEEAACYRVPLATAGMVTDAAP